jgi:uncharacterized protein
MLILFLFVIAVVTPEIAFSDDAARTYPLTWQFNLKVAMRDGVQLSTDVIRPDSTDRFPAILIRTPYNKGVEPSREDPIFYATHGYAVVVQDVRGRYDSDGAWDPFIHEADDGFDAEEWVASQPWSDGQLITYGGSYLSLDQWLAATRKNSHVRAMISMVGQGDLYKGLFHVGGAFQLALSIIFGDLVDGRVVQEQDFAFAPWLKAFQHRPVIDALIPLGRNPSFYREWVRHSAYDDYWKRLRWEDRYEDFDLPVLNIGGWFDLFQSSTVEAFVAMSTRSPTRVRDKQQLVIGPWIHDNAGGAPTLRPAEKQGDIDFGPEALIDLRTFVLQWMDHHVKHIDNGMSHELPVKLFTMGENVWHSYRQWPIPETMYTKYYFHSDGKANSLLGDGTLDVSPPVEERPDLFNYDPENPVLTLGGANCCGQDIFPAGPMDQVPVERRDDVLIYTTAPLEKDMLVTGSVKVVLWFATSAQDTDFTAKIVDVYPNGFALNLTDGILRARYRNSFEKPEFLSPGTLYKITIDAGNTSNLFKKGHRIRIEVSSSNFPRFSRNTNTNGEPELEIKSVVARQTVRHDGDHPSHLLLPVLPQDSLTTHSEGSK